MITRTPISPLERSLTEWLEAGLIRPDQVDAIRLHEQQAAAPATPAARPRRVPVVAEALGYLGSMLGVIGLVLLITHYWPDLSTPVRLALAGGATVILTAAGLLIPHRDEPALERLRGFLWLGATATGALTGGVFAHGLFDARDAKTLIVCGAAVVTVLSGALWAGRAYPLQQATFLIGLLVTVGLLGDRWLAEGSNGVLVWALAGIILAGGVVHATSFPPVTISIGAASAMIGAALTIPSSRGDGLLFLLLTTGVVMGLAAMTWPVRTATDRVVLTVVGTFGALQAVPQTVAWFARDAGIATGLTVFAVGMALVLLARRPAVATPLVMQIVGGLAMVAGTAITGVESVAFATTFGLLVAVGLILLGTLPGNVLMSLFGCIGLLVNVPWAIGHFFPGQGRAPLLIAVSGVLIVLVAVWLSRQGGELRHTFHRHPRRT